MNVSREVLITGFGAFPGVECNPTEELIRSIQSKDSHNGTRHQVLPVSFTTVFEHLNKSVKAYAPTKILHLGVASEATEVRIETQAVNHMVSRVPDIDGRQPRNARIDRSHPQEHCLAGSPKADSIITSIESMGYPVRRSADAGRYVCNALFYSSLASFGSSKEVTFIHLPPLGSTHTNTNSSFEWTLVHLVMVLEQTLKVL